MRLPRLMWMVGMAACVGTISLNGQVKWTRVFGTTTDDVANGVAAGATGVYVVGYTSGALPGQASSGSDDAFIRKYDPSGNELWTRQFGSSSSDSATGVAADATGAYVVGYTSGALPGQTSSGSDDAFIRKYDPSGNELWTRQFGTPNADYAYGAGADATGVYVVGAAFGALPGQTNSGLDDAYIRKYDPSGNELWTRQYGTSGYDFAQGVAVDATGAHVAGTTARALPGQTSSGSYDAFIRKYDPSGNELWTRQFGSSGYDYAYGVAVDATGTYVAGYTSGALPDQTSSGGADAFIRKYDSSGNELWTHQFGTSGHEYAAGVAADATGAYVAGYTSGALPGQSSSGGQDAFIRKYDPSGNELWTGQFGTSGDDNAFGVTSRQSGLYLAGVLYGVNTQSKNAFVARLR